MYVTIESNQARPTVNPCQYERLFLASAAHNSTVTLPPFISWNSNTTTTVYVTIM